MPQTHFICGDGKQILIEDCINKGCRLGDRCLSKRALRQIGRRRKLEGFSITELLNGTREIYLKRTYNFAIDPLESIFALIGTRTHNGMEFSIGDDELGEERLHDDVCSGQFDYYDPEERTLYDTKTYGSYKVMRALGLRDVPTNEVYQRGAKKGQFKTKKAPGGYRDVLDVAIQLNYYQNLLEKILPEGYGVKYRKVEILVRDGGTYMADNRGITKKAYNIKINRISPHWINKWKEIKAGRLQRALDTGIVPPKCSKRDSWGGRKCDGYCNVSHICKEIEGGMKNAKIREYNQLSESIS